MVINRPGNWLLICSLVTNSGRQRAITRLNYSLKINKTPQRQRESLDAMVSSLYFRTEQFTNREKVTPTETQEKIIINIAFVNTF